MLKIQDFQNKIDDRFAQSYDIQIGNFEKQIGDFIEQDNLDLYPDFQRGRVWTEAQKSSFCEFLLKHGKTSPLLFNHAGWQSGESGSMVIVDGLQRLTAIQGLLNDQVKIFDHYLSEFDDKLSYGKRFSIKIKVHSLQTRAEVLQWYLQVNGTGTPHTIEEIGRVQELLRAESFDQVPKVTAPERSKEFDGGESKAILNGLRRLSDQSSAIE
jgi:Protein of unknown function DUF262